MMVSQLNSSSFVFHGFLLGEGWEVGGGNAGGGHARKIKSSGNSLGIGLRTTTFKTFDFLLRRPNCALNC